MSTPIYCTCGANGPSPNGPTGAKGAKKLTEAKTSSLLSELGLATKVLIVGIIGTLILAVWSVVITTSIRHYLNIGHSVRDAIIVAIVSTILGIIVLKIVQVDIKTALGSSIEGRSAVGAVDTAGAAADGAGGNGGGIDVGNGGAGGGGGGGGGGD